jgi:hypothetical protein
VAAAQASGRHRCAAAYRAAWLVRGCPVRLSGPVARRAPGPVRRCDGWRRLPANRPFLPPLPRQMLASRILGPRTPPRAARPGARGQDPGDRRALRADAGLGAVRHSAARPAEARHGGIGPGSGPRAPAAGTAPHAGRVHLAGSRSRTPGDFPALARPDSRGGRAPGRRRPVPLLRVPLQRVQPQSVQLQTQPPRSGPERPRPGPERAPWPEPDTPRSSQCRDLRGGRRPHPARSRHLRRASTGPGRLCRWPGRPASACPILLQRSAGRGLWPRPTRSR